MKLVYITGPYRASTINGIRENIERARSAALDVWRLGAAAICPHANTAFFDGAAADEVWLRGGIEILGRCDAVFVIAGSQRSEGTQSEIEYMQNCGKPVFYDWHLIEEWIKSA